MHPESFEIRVCISCGLRYPRTEGSTFGFRCPHCLGETQAVSRQVLGGERISQKKEIEAKETPILAVLADNLRSAWNVGSILRSADGFGFAHAYLCGITPTPEKEAVAKTSLGAEDFVSWSHHKDALMLVNGLKKAGWKVLALEEDKRAVKAGDIKKPDRNTVLIVGNEVTGIDPGLLDLADEIIHIPMRGGKRSLNVAIAFSVTAFTLTDH